MASQVPSDANDAFQHNEHVNPGRRRLSRAFWATAFFSIAALVIVRIDLFPLSTQVLVDGMHVDVPRMFFTVDHPFHIARSHLIADAWRSFETVRWVANHQGGYPAEFFPFGVHSIVAGLHFLSLGFLSIASSYTFTVVGLYLLPGLAYLTIARADGVSRGAALLAFTGHVAIASTWLQGGYNELIDWGLVTNASGAFFALLTLPLLTIAVQDGKIRWAMVATTCIVVSAFGNPRSLLAIAVIALAIVIHTSLFSGRKFFALVWLAALGGLAIVVCAPLFFPLFRSRELYYFLHFEEYDSALALADSTLGTVTWPIALFTLSGCFLPFRHATHRVSQVVSLTLIVYASVTLLAIEASWIRELVPQLELPRLMPFQRLLMLYLAGYAAIEFVRLLAGRFFRFPFLHFATIAGTIAILVIFASDVGPRDREGMGLRPVPRTDGAAALEIANLRLAVEHADEVAPDHTAILVLESTLSWHEQLWGPIWSDRRFYYDDWLWYWHKLHEGPYDFRVGHAYPKPSDSLNQEYLTTHGIGAVVVTNDPAFAGGNARNAAAQSDLLQMNGTFGDWDVFTVEDASPIATLDGMIPAQTDVSGDGERISLSFANAAPGTILVRQNWFPRWTATINGAAVEIERGSNGYIEIPTQGGDLAVELTYSVTTADIVARGLSMLGVGCVAIGFIAGVTPIRRWAHRSGLEDRG